MKRMQPPIDNREAEADRVIRSHVGLSVGTGLIPIPLADLASVAALQLAMLKQLARIYDQDFNSDSLRSFIATVSTAMIGSLVVRVGSSVAKAVPAFGQVLGATAQATLSGASTYALGRIFKRYLKQGLSLEEIDVRTIRVEVRREYEQGKLLSHEVEQENGGDGKDAD